MEEHRASCQNVVSSEILGQWLSKLVAIYETYASGWITFLVVFSIVNIVSIPWRSHTMVTGHRRARIVCSSAAQAAISIVIIFGSDNLLDTWRLWCTVWFTMIRHRFACRMIANIVNTTAIATAIVGIIPSATIIITIIIMDIVVIAAAATAAAINGWCGTLSK